MSPRSPMSIDLNCDLGESTDPAQVAKDLALLDIVTSANIACGGHAGDDSTMWATFRAAMERVVAIGAHPGYPDRANFGRVAVTMTTDALEESIYSQVASLQHITESIEVSLTHIKLHGALYHRAMTDAATADAVAAAALRIDPTITLVAMPSTVALRVWRQRGFTVLVEAFADRAYEADGSLRARTKTGALITDPRAAAAQALSLARSATPKDGPHTLCIHSDTPGAVAVARAVRTALEAAGNHPWPPTRTD